MGGLNHIRDDKMSDWKRASMYQRRKLDYAYFPWSSFRRKGVCEAVGWSTLLAVIVRARKWPTAVVRSSGRRLRSPLGKWRLRSKLG